MLFSCFANVTDGGPALKQHWVDVSCWEGVSKLPITQINYNITSDLSIKYMPINYISILLLSTAYRLRIILRPYTCYRTCVHLVYYGQGEKPHIL